MHAGVERDMENQRVKRERQADFEAQRKMEEEYRKVQRVSDGKKKDGMMRVNERGKEEGG